MLRQLLGMRSNIFLECTQDKHDTDYIIDRVFLNVPYGLYKPDTDVTWPCEYFWLLQTRGRMLEYVYNGCDNGCSILKASFTNH